MTESSRILRSYKRFKEGKISKDVFVTDVRFSITESISVWYSFKHFFEENPKKLLYKDEHRFFTSETFLDFAEFFTNDALQKNSS